MKPRLRAEHIFVLLIFIMIPVFVWLLAMRFLPGKNLPPAENKQTSPTPASTNPIPSGVPREKVLQVIKTSPFEDTNITYSPIQPLEFSFNNSVDVSGIKYKIAPQTDVVVKNGTYPNKIFIYPKSEWKTGSTRIVILSGSISSDGSTLYAPFTYELITAEPTPPPHAGGDY